MLQILQHRIVQFVAAWCIYTVDEVVGKVKSNETVGDARGAMVNLTVVSHIIREGERDASDHLIQLFLDVI